MKKTNAKVAKSFLSFLLMAGFILLVNSCGDTATATKDKTAETSLFPSDVTPFFSDWKLILGDGSNAGDATKKESKDYFYAKNDGKANWVVYKTPNAGNTHGTSNNTRTELAQVKK